MDTGAGEPRDESRDSPAPSVQVPSALLEGRNRVDRARVAPPVRAHVRVPGVGTALHDGDAVPRLVAILGHVILVTSTVPGWEFLVVDSLHALREQPGEHETLICKRLLATDRSDAVALAVRREVVDDDPLDRGVMRVVAVQETKAIDLLVLIRMFAREEQLPAPELRVVHPFDGRDVLLEGVDDAVAFLAEADAERAIRLLARGPRRCSVRELLEFLFRDAPVSINVLRAKCADLLVNGLLERVGVHPRFRELQHIRHELVVAHELREDALGRTATQTKETREKLTSLIDIDHGRVPLKNHL